MLSGGVVPCLPGWPIKRISFQTKHGGYDTDDLVVFVERGPAERRKLVAQIKHSVTIAANNPTFEQVIQAAWSDFNNKEIFSRGSDILALITGPLPAVDVAQTRWMLDQAQRVADADTFFTMSKQAKFFSGDRRKKLDAFRVNLDKAAGGVRLSDEQVFEFLKHFRLLSFDLDLDASVTLALLHSVIGQVSSQNPADLFGRLVDEVASFNSAAGDITRETLPFEILESFEGRVAEIIPSALSKAVAPVSQPDWSLSPHARDLAKANLIGSWEEGSTGDLAIVATMVGETYANWIGQIRVALNEVGSPLSLKNGTWKVSERGELWSVLTDWIFDEDLDRILDKVPLVLTETDAQFDLPTDERYLAAVRGKVLAHSHALRTALAETLALLASRGTDLGKVTLGKPEAVAWRVVRTTLDNADWLRWASLDSLLPLLAEAAPTEFISAVEIGLGREPCPFDELFRQEGNGITGRTYVTGLLWALETLAWDPDLLVPACSILGDLAARDPGGNWANRPAASLATILLPWLPQTIAPLQKREVAVQTLLTEVPDVGWKLLLALLPNQFQTSMGTRKPVWRATVPADWQKGVSQKEYVEAVSYYADLAVHAAKGDVRRLTELVDCIGSLPKAALDALLVEVSADAVASAPESDRLPLWTALVSLAHQHRRFSEAEWALDADTISRIEDVARRIAPASPANRFRRLFTRHETELYAENGNWEEQRQKLEDKRSQALSEMMAADGVSGVLAFAETVEAPAAVGWSLGGIANELTDLAILPALLVQANPQWSELCRGYVARRHSSDGLTWVDSVDRAGWSSEQIGVFLSLMPFETATWQRVVEWLGDSDGAYWTRTNTWPPQVEADIWTAVDKLVEWSRPRAAIDCIGRVIFEKLPLDVERTAKVLLAAVTSSEPVNNMDVYHAQEAIQALQDDVRTNPEQLFAIEWAYLGLLDRGTSQATPKTLEGKLATDPGFFCEVVRAIYRPEGTDNSEESGDDSNSTIAVQAWRLLNGWRTPPGTLPDGSFSSEAFQQWIATVKGDASKTGHLNVALEQAGEVIYYAPPDPSGLWIEKTVAAALNARDAERMRSGFNLRAYNSRGMHWVDPTGAVENELAAGYHLKADQVENVGLARFAASLRMLAKSYEHDAMRIVDEHGSEGASGSEPEDHDGSECVSDCDA
jgi:hypothetical protein